MGIDKNLIDVLSFYKALGFEDLPISFFNSLGNSQVDDKTDILNHHPEDIEKLNEEIINCTKCPLSKVRRISVCGEGNLNAKIMFIGEAPGVEEDIQGRPFVGEAGKLLTSLIEKMGFKRQDVYITNVVKCHPPNNRDPLELEISICFDYLKREIKLISPQVIMALGKVATFALKGMNGKIKDIQISKLRGKTFFYGEIPVVPTFHPAYLLRNRKDKWLTWEDAKEVLKKLR